VFSAEDQTPDDDPAYIQELTETIWKKAWAEGSKVVKALEEFDWRSRHAPL
jgi:hypothetical protein